ncbi:MAG: VWA domain-containing protein, partial [Candidatus Moranbacteria bacterium]|nr:VWA domain-containing protein [Candidatus Moranbacteria bacterium]
ISSLSDVKTILKASLSKSSSCDKVFDKTWTDLLLPTMGAQRRSKDLGNIPPGLKPLIEKHIAEIMQRSTETEGIEVDENEMEELLKQGRPQIYVPEENIEIEDSPEINDKQADELNKILEELFGKDRGDVDTPKMSAAEWEEFFKRGGKIKLGKGGSGQSKSKDPGVDFIIPPEILHKLSEPTKPTPKGSQGKGRGNQGSPGRGRGKGSGRGMPYIPAGMDYVPESVKRNIKNSIQQLREQREQQEKIDKILDRCQSKGLDSREGIKQCMLDINKEVQNLIKEGFNKRKLSKITNLSNKTDNLIKRISKKINRETSIPNQEAIKLKGFVKQLTALKDSLKKSIDQEVKEMDIVPRFGDSISERKFIENFMKGGVGGWGAPHFVEAITQNDYFQSRVREGLKSLKTRRGHKSTVSERGKILAARHTIRQGMRKGMISDLFYKKKPPKQKEDIVWLVDTSGSMGNSYAFIKPIVDSMDQLGLRQRFFLGTEESLEVKPHSNFKETLERLSTHGTQLSLAYDEIRPEVGSWKNKTFILYSDMEDAEPKKFEEKLNEIVNEGGKVLILNNDKNNEWDKKYVEAVASRDPIIEFENVDDYETLINTLKKASPIIKK